MNLYKTLLISLRLISLDIKYVLNKLFFYKNETKTSVDWKNIVKQLQVKGVLFEKGLKESELKNIERLYGFNFPLDLRSFLKTVLPSNKGFPNWRNDSEEKIRNWLKEPLDGIQFDIQYNDFWLPEWGLKPENIEESLQISERLVLNAPTLIPIFGHRMMPDRPCDSGNPILSVHQTDIIYYGYDLIDYFAHEFKIVDDRKDTPTVKHIDFWDIDRFQEVRWGDDNTGLNLDIKTLADH